MHIQTPLMFVFAGPLTMSVWTDFVSRNTFYVHAVLVHPDPYLPSMSPWGTTFVNSIANSTSFPMISHRVSSLVTFTSALTRLTFDWWLFSGTPSALMVLVAASSSFWYSFLSLVELRFVIVLFTPFMKGQKY